MKNQNRINKKYSRWNPDLDLNEKLQCDMDMAVQSKQKMG